jgi:serine/threonine protein phosphatase 1
VSDLIYAVGDVHGCYDQLRAAIAKIETHADGRPHRGIFLGDYVDRGPKSREVVGFVKELVTGTNGIWRALMGNHEDMMLGAHKGQSISQWLSNGGLETEASYAGHQDEMKWHIDWLGSLPSLIETENHLFVHAGLSKRYLLAEQPEEVRLWIRGWQRDDHDFGKHVVYGHQPFDMPELRTFSSGLDTGACYGGPLTVGVFDASLNGGPVDILQAH